MQCFGRGLVSCMMTWYDQQPCTCTYVVCTRCQSQYCMYHASFTRTLARQNIGKIIIHLALAIALMNIFLLFSRDRHMMASDTLCMLSAVTSHFSLLCVLAWLCMLAQCLYALPFGGSIEEASAKRRRLYILKRCIPAYGTYMYAYKVLEKCMQVSSTR